MTVREALCNHWDAMPIVVNGAVYGRFCNDCNKMIEKEGDDGTNTTERLAHHDVLVTVEERGPSGDRPARD
jgi:hypothetical protein